MSPILVRPVREQLEHDRVIRLLQAKYKRKYEVAINPGNEQTAPVGPGPSPWYPDLVLQSADRGRKLAGVVEVETAESVNNLEAMSQWATFARLRVPFHLYLPTASIDSARRFCSDFSIPVAEMWAYQAVGDQLRFTLVQRAPQAGDGKASAAAETPSEGRARAAAKPAGRAAEPARASRPASRRAPARPRAAAASRTGRRTTPSASGVRRTVAKAARRAPAAKPAARGKAKAARRSPRPQKRR